MAQECGFFNAQLVGEEYDRVYLAEQFAAYFASFIGNGVFGSSMQQLEVVANNDMTTNVLSGQAWINGWWYRNTDVYTLSHSVADGVLSRIDIVVLRWDHSARDMYLTVIEGTPSANPVKPAIVRNADYYDLQLCTVSIPAGSIRITQAQITDTRLDNSVCGLVTGVVDQIDTTSLFSQFMTAYQEWKDNQQADYEDWTADEKQSFEDWWDGVKDLLDPEPAGQLALAIQRLRAQIGIPDVYDPKRIYEPGEYCIHDNTLQKCTKKTIGGGFDAGYWRATTVIKEIELSVAEAQEAMKADIGEDRKRLDGLEARTDILTYNGAGLHNALYRGKYLGTEVTAEQYAAIEAGTFEDLYIGDYWVINARTWRIAAFDYYLTTGDIACKTHHVTIVPDTNLDEQPMNSSATTTGGYLGSIMHALWMTTAKNDVIAAFGSAHILSHRLFLDNTVTNGYPSARAWVDSQIELMSEQNVYGGKLYHGITNGTNFPNILDIDKSQYPLFVYDPHMISNGQTYWLRNVASASTFAVVGGSGFAGYGYDASKSLGVRPAFSIKS